MINKIGEGERGEIYLMQKRGGTDNQYLPDIIGAPVVHNSDGAGIVRALIIYRSDVPQLDAIVGRCAC